MKNGKLEVTKINCKIKGLRSDSLKEHLARKESEKLDLMDDGSVLVKITGCEYRVTEERLKAELSHWGTITTDID